MSCPDHANSCCAQWCINCREDEQAAARAREADAICKSLALSNPDATEDGEVWCAVCDRQIHTEWPALSEHGDECAYARARLYVSGDARAEGEK